MAEQAKRFQQEHDWLRSAVCNEPRGHEAMVGALLCKPHEPDCICGVIFFNNISTLNMCIHGTIGLTHAEIQTARAEGETAGGRTGAACRGARSRRASTALIEPDEGMAD